MYENNSNNPNSAVMRDIFRPGGRKDVRFSDQTKIIRLLAQSATSGRRARLRSPPSSVFLRAFLGIPGLVDLVGKPPTARINLVMHRHLVTDFRSITLKSCSRVCCGMSLTGAVDHRLSLSAQGRPQVFRNAGRRGADPRLAGASKDRSLDTSANAPRLLSAR